ncbi:MAG: phytoene/squalene synthase family protein, partial [Actinomycetes bacterium]
MAVSRRDLDAAGITDPGLRASYERCRRLNAVHGRTYYLATLLLPPAKRPHVHALYGFARHADEYVDDLAHPRPDELVGWGERLLDDLAAGDSDDAIGKATVHTARAWDLPAEHFAAFLASMRLDLTVTGYQTFADLRGYMYGSAGVIGLQMAPILEPLDESAYGYARTLGEAFQLTNFIRDVGEDLDRGRVYLPQEDLDRFAVTRDDLAAGHVTEPIRCLLRFEIDRTRGLYDEAAPGIDLLHPSSRDCIRTALTLYRGILDAVERADYQVLTQR